MSRAEQAPWSGADIELTERVSAYATDELRADLVGFANIERFDKAPLRMSPQGLLPTARSVVVMAVHHPDACIEMGGRTHPQEIGPYRVQYWMNNRLDEMSYRMGLFLERAGFAAIPIVSSNIWRYKGYKDLKEHFAPDVSHRHTAVAAGIADFGISALAITPEYGARVRFVTVVTDAELAPTPLMEPGSVCDGCNLCVRHCPAQALSKEVAGESVVEIEDKRYTYLDKNLWRCAWGEHFDLDLDLPIPEVVDEDVILEQVALHGRRGGEMGCCLRYCVPRARRYHDRAYTNAPRRRREEPSTDVAALSAVVEEAARPWAIEFTAVTDAEALAQRGVALADHLPDGQVAITLGVLQREEPHGDPAAAARRYLLEMAAYDVCRALEREGHSAVCCTDIPATATAPTRLGGWRADTTLVVTSAPLPTTSAELEPPAVAPRAPRELKAAIAAVASELGADLVGVAPAARLRAVAPRLAELFDGEEVLNARDRARPFQPYEPVVESAVVHTRVPSDFVDGARSVIVLGLRLPQASVTQTGVPPAEAVGPLAFAQYEAVNLLRLMAYRVMRVLENAGGLASLSFDLCGTASTLANPRGEQPDAFANSFAALAAGLGRLSRAGFLLTPEFGPSVRFVAVVTDLEVEADPLMAAPLADPCRGCTHCLDACPADAFGELESLAMGGRGERFHVIDRKRCDWSKRYSLTGEEGVQYLGWDLHLPAPEVIDAETLADGLRQQPPIPKYRPCSYEACVMACPLTR